jgi:hypothetical protein
LSCSDKPNERKQTNAGISIDTSHAIFTDHSEAKIQIFRDSAGPDNVAWVYESTEINYQMLDVQYNQFGQFFSDISFIKDDIELLVAKITTDTKASQGSEKSEKTYTVEIMPSESPKHKPFIINQKCDNISFEHDYYKIAIYGCCGGDDQFAFYDYQNQLIIEGDVKIAIADIPNSRIKFYAAYKNSENDSSVLGTLYFSYGSTDHYKIRIRSTPALSSNCEYRTPEIFIYSSDLKDTAEINRRNDTYRLWSLNNLKDKAGINNIFLKLAFECNTADKTDTVVIPIINGKPFGKDDGVQEYSYRK